MSIGKFSLSSVSLQDHSIKSTWLSHIVWPHLLSLQMSLSKETEKTQPSWWPYLNRDKDLAPLHNLSLTFCSHFNVDIPLGYSWISEFAQPGANVKEIKGNSVQMKTCTTQLLAISTVLHYDRKEPSVVGLIASSGCFTAHWLVWLLICLKWIHRFFRHTFVCMN